MTHCSAEKITTMWTFGEKTLAVGNFVYEVRYLYENIVHNCPEIENSFIYFRYE